MVFITNVLEICMHLEHNKKQMFENTQLEFYQINEQEVY